jgi:hypothetical protein
MRGLRAGPAELGEPGQHPGTCPAASGALRQSQPLCLISGSDGRNEALGEDIAVVAEQQARLSQDEVKLSGVAVGNCATQTGWHRPLTLAPQNPVSRQRFSSRPESASAKADRSPCRTTTQDCLLAFQDRFGGLPPTTLGN